MKETEIQFRIDKKAKADFIAKCEQCKTTASEALRKFVKYYIKQKEEK